MVGSGGWRWGVVSGGEWWLEVESEPQTTGFERDKIDEADGIVTRQRAGAFTWIEDQRIAVLFVPMAMRVTV